jgi:chaperonin cofactor prefoldin
LTITELKKTINKLEITITQIENSKQISEAEIERLNEIIKKSKLDKEELSKRDITIS